MKVLVVDNMATNRKPKGEGSGIGLVVVNRIVKSHGGAITVLSSPGEGTTFQVCLPAYLGEVGDGRAPAGKITDHRPSPVTVAAELNSGGQ